MSNFLNSLVCEWIKIKGSALIWVSILGSIVLSTVFTLRFIYLGHYIDLWAVDNSWQRLYLQNIRPFTGFLLPIGVILICSLITQIEYKNNNWKHWHTTPQSYLTIFFSKFSILMILMAFVYFFFNLGVILNGIIPNLICNGVMPRDSIPFEFFASYSLKSFLSILPIVGLQYLVSLNFKNFIIAIGVGLVLYVGTMPMSRIEFSFLSPYSYALHFFDLKFHSAHYIRAVVYFILLFVLTTILYINKKDKS